MSVTIKDIAKRVGRSVTTVSRALNDYDDVSPATKALVRQAAIEMGYSPNIAAQRLQKRRTDTIGFIIPSFGPRLSDPFFSELLSGVTEETARHDFDLLVTTFSSSEDESKRYLEYIRSRRVDGFILIRTQRSDPRIPLLQEHNYPFVAFGRVEEANNFPFVDEDGGSGIRQVVNHLVELGHTKLACIAEPMHLTKSYHRVRGFCKAMEENGLTIYHERIIEGGFRQRSGHQIGHQLLEMKSPPTAIVAVNDLLALGAMRAAQERGLVVGRDVSITGFDDIVLAEYTHPPLTTVRQPAHLIGTKLCQMLVKLIKREELDKKQIILKPDLIVRQSTGPVRR